MVKPYKSHWQTKEGRLLLPEEMETSHIFNALNMLARLARKVYLQQARELHDRSLDAIAYAGTAPDGAAMAAESEAQHMAEQAHEYRDMAFDDAACRALILKNFPVTKQMERIYLERQAALRVERIEVAA